MTDKNESVEIISLKNLMDEHKKYRLKLHQTNKKLMNKRDPIKIKYTVEIEAGSDFQRELIEGLFAAYFCVIELHFVNSHKDNKIKSTKEI